MKTGIVLEGGAVRTIYSTGVCDALLTRDLLPDYVIGVSAGIAYGVSYVSKQPAQPGYHGPLYQRQAVYGRPQPAAAG